MGKGGGVKSVMPEINALMEDIEKISDRCDRALDNLIHFPTFEVEFLYRRIGELISEIKKSLHAFRHTRFTIHRTNSIYYSYFTEQLNLALHSLSVYQKNIHKRWYGQNKCNPSSH
ncbi:unnamed protein product [Hymenolepis diminuta]|uniref:Uncharacterized protein n=1 Tax=Hymenolepis diminuta TaxID=6216 RepID=A0A564Z992_HYMDI|nr:unnamed protein product [Hymenolepis diminuta]